MCFVDMSSVNCLEAFLYIVFRRGFLLGWQPCTPIWCRVRRMVWALTGWLPTSSISAAMLTGLLRRSFKESIWMWRSAHAFRFLRWPTRGLFWVDPALLKRWMILATVLQLRFFLSFLILPVPTNYNCHTHIPQFFVFWESASIFLSFLLFSLCGLLEWYYYICFTYLEFFHNSVSWWSFTGVWVKACLLKSPGLFSEWAQQCCSLNILDLSSDFQLFQLFGIVPRIQITIRISVNFMFHSFFWVLPQGPSTYLFFRFLWFSHCSPLGRRSPRL